MKSSGLVSVLRNLRTAFYWGLEPFDSLFRRVNKMAQYPPIPYRRHVGYLGNLDGSGYEFVAYLRLLLDLHSGDRLWDLGCGCGMLELALESLGWRGDLVGNDIHRPSIKWAQKTVGVRQKSFVFLHSDIYNAAYWRSGTLTARQWLDDFRYDGFTVIIAKSLFTHMFPDELNLYLSHLVKRLGPGGQGLLTFFLLNPEQGAKAQQGLSDIVFTNPAGVQDYAVRRLDAPSAAVAYKEEFLKKMLAQYGLKITRICYGRWSGRIDGLSYQDLVLIRKS